MVKKNLKLIKTGPILKKKKVYTNLKLFILTTCENFLWKKWKTDKFILDSKMSLDIISQAKINTKCFFVRISSRPKEKCDIEKQQFRGWGTEFGMIKCRTTDIPEF